MDFILNPSAAFLIRIGLTPNIVSILSMAFAIIAGISYYFSYLYPINKLIYLLLALVFVVLNSFADAVDGVMARQNGMQSNKGDFLDHVIDRYADTIIICGIFFAGYVHWMMGVVAITGVLITSYIGTQAQAVGIQRDYGGIMGRADRLLFIFIANIVNIIYPHEIYGLEALGWVIVIIAITSHITAIQRFFHIWGTVER